MPRLNFPLTRAPGPESEQRAAESEQPAERIVSVWYATIPTDWRLRRRRIAHRGFGRFDAPADPRQRMQRLLQRVDGGRAGRESGLSQHCRNLPERDVRADRSQPIERELCR